MVIYSLGFLFNKKKNKVALIEKRRPKQICGYLNGIGGKLLNDQENPKTAMAREFLEETGVKTNEDDWISFVEMTGQDWKCFCYCCFDNNYINQVKTTTDEKVVVLNVKDCVFSIEKVLEEIPMLIMMAISPANFSSIKINF